MKFLRACLVEPKKFEIFEVEEFPKDNQLLVKVASCGLCNWELNFWNGRLNFMGYPHLLGHEWSGTVVEVGHEVKTIKVGDNISGFIKEFGGFAEYKTIPENSCRKLSPDIDPKYALGEPQKCVMTVIRGVRPEPGDNGVILGSGPMGLWCIQALHGSMLNSLIAIDINDNKLAMAKKFGATHTINCSKENVVEFLSEVTNGHLADFVIEGTGIPGLLNEAQLYMKTGNRGRLAIMSSYETVAREFDFRIVIEKAFEIIIPHPGYSLNEVDDFRRAVLLINNGTFKTSELVSHEFALSDIQKAFETLENKPSNYLKGIVVP